MKTVIKLLVAALIVNATARLGLSAWTQYQFRDSVQELVLFGSTETPAELKKEIIEEAADQGVPVADDDVLVDREGMLTTAQATYVDEIELFPRYVYPMTWTFKVDARRIAGQ
jgi:hypothetical protein